MRSPITKLAVAAALAFGIFLLFTHLSSRETTTPPARIVRKTTDLGQMELARAEELFLANDVTSLVSLLETGRYGTKIEVAQYLGQIGDPSAVAALEPLAAQWKGAPDLNPFQKAIDTIQERQEPDRNEPNVPAEEKPEQTPPETATESQLPPSTDAHRILYAGQVTDEAGHPVAGVRVWGQVISDAFGNAVLAEETLTDDDGNFRLTTSRPVERQEILRVLHFDHPEYGMAWRSLERSDEDLQDMQVTLHAPAAVAGVVVDDQDQPIPDARIEADVRLSTDGRTDQLMLWDLTDMALYADDQGAFVLDRLPAPATLRLRVSAEGYALHTTDRDSSGGPFPIRAGDEDLHITLQPGNAIAGRIVYEDGTPYHHRAVAMVEGPGAHELIFATEEDGTFVSPGLSAGLYQVSILKDESKPLCTPAEVQVDLAEAPSEVVLTVLPPEQPVAVQVVDEITGEPLKGVWVRAEFSEGGEGSVSRAQTDETGFCILPVPPGQYRIVAQGWRNGQFADFAEEIVLEPGQTDASVILAMTARAHITGWLIDADGRPVQGFVQIDSGAKGQTDPNGRFALDEPFGDAFEYKVGWAYDPPQQLGKLFLFRKADYDGELALLLEPCAILAGRIVSGSGTPQSDVTLKLGVCKPGGGTIYFSQVPWTIANDEKGNFVIEKVPLGVAVRVSAERTGLQGGVDIDELLPGQFYDTGDIVLRGVGGIDENTDWTGVLEGTITDENGKPVTSTRVQAYTGTDRFETTTDRRGRFKLTGLPKGVRLNFSLYLPAYGHCHKYVYADTDDGNMQIFPQGWELLGKPAPPLSIATWYNSKPLTLEELRGTIVLLQIGVLLPLYGDDLTTMQKVYEKYADRGLEIIAVHQPLDVTWGGQVTEDELQRFVSEDNVPFAFCLDKERQTYIAYAPKATPALYLVDREGRVVISPTMDNLDDCIEQLLDR